MSQNRMVSVQFTANDTITMRIMKRKGELPCNFEWWEDGFSENCWDNIGSAATVVTTYSLDPSTWLENGYVFMRSSLPDTPDRFDPDNSGSAVVFRRAAVTPGAAATTERFVFTVEGFLTHESDLYQPINGTIFIGPPAGVSNPNNRLSRAVSILGATGRVNAWQWRNEWRPVR